MRRTRLTPARAGMTLIELLVVMTIIAILAALSLGAIFTVRESQLKSFAETLVNKLASAHDGQWKAAADQIREEPVPQWAVAIAGNDPQRAKVVYLKARLKQEFPVTFYEAIYPYATHIVGANANPTILPVGALPPKATYRKAIPNVATWFPDPTPAGVIRSPVPAPDSTLPMSPPAPEGFESAVLLYLTLTQGRRGQAGFNPDEHIEPTAIQSRSVTIGSTVYQFKYFVDSWGNPIRYWTFPYSNDELNNAPYYDASKPQNQQSPDPQDPDQALFVFPIATLPTFVSMIHPVQVIGTVGTNRQTRLKNLIPVIASAGRDGKWGVDNGYSDMSQVGTANPAEVSDNIYSYRLRRSGARGD